MSLYFAPEELRRHLENQQAAPVLQRQTNLVLFRDELIRLLRKIRVKTITGSFTVSSVAIGSTELVHVDHTSSEVYGAAWDPVFTPVTDVSITVLRARTINSINMGTSGASFVVAVENLNNSDMAGAGQLFSWSRDGYPF